MSDFPETINSNIPSISFNDIFQQDSGTYLVVAISFPSMHLLNLYATGV